MQREDGSLWIADRHGKEISDYHVSQGSSQDCGPHAVSVALNFSRGETIFHAPDLARQMNKPRLLGRIPFLVIRRIPNWATFPWGMVDVMRENGLQARWRLGASETHLREGLREDRLLLPIFGEPLRWKGGRGWSHVAVLVGWDDQDCWFVDSSSESPLRSRPRAEFLALWRNMGRLVVEAS